ncbi:MFS transporter [Luteibacter aegosomatissinici]|uniref:MFS transporter n=1 Tax=Luteibacter aegosomatissinici TaxID=2911539 RepID=UPI001FFC19FF|nr:MFS transporter [Luteibacter aegosomatissinici]UPG92720.1 MFS transporter [Luteibacter aegosomatissinici]
MTDIGSAIGAGVDERAWITTAFSVAQMLTGPVAAWLGLVFGLRRVLMGGAVLYSLSQLLLPFCQNLPLFIAVQFLAGLGSGTFIPLTIGVVLKNLPKPFWVLGISAYALNLELTLNIAATLEGWHIDHGGWRWIFWQNLPIALALVFCIMGGIPKEPVNRAELVRGDYWGMFLAGVGFSLVYACLDQGNRLDWTSSGLIVGLAIGGLVLLAAFAIHEFTNPFGAIEFSFLAKRNILILALLLALARMLVLSSNFLVPQFLTTVGGFRPTEVGDLLLWVALPQFLIGPLVGLVLLRVDARWVLGGGILLVCIACLLASRLTPDWAEAQFIPSMLLQALGQTMALTALIYYFVLHLTPALVLTFGAIAQTARLFGGEIAVAVIQTFQRVQSQVHSNLVGLHVGAGEADTNLRLVQYSTGPLLRFGGSNDPANAGRSLALLSSAVRTQAQTLSFSDTFLMVAATAVLGLALVALLQRPPPSEPA